MIMGREGGGEMYLLILMGIFLLLGVVKWHRSKYRFEDQLKKCESPIEEQLIRKLYEEGFRPYAQVPCGAYRIDIALYIKHRKVAIECDGHAFHSTPEQLAHDEKKNIFLKKNRWHVFRFKGKEIYRQPEWCVKVIKKRYRVAT